jgi:hypothetical protein
MTKTSFKDFIMNKQKFLQQHTNKTFNSKNICKT